MILANNYIILAKNVWPAFVFSFRVFFLFPLPSSKMFAICTITSYSFQFVHSPAGFSFFYFSSFMGHEPSQFAPLDPDLEDENNLVQLIPILLEQIRARRPGIPSPASRSILTGRLYVEELLAGNNNIFRTVARMDKQTFTRLVILMRGAGLNDTPHISVEEKLLIHIHVCVGLSNRQIGHRFQHSGQTIFKIVREVLGLMRAMNHMFMVVPDINTPISSVIGDNPKYAEFFQNCIGALDGTMILAIVCGRDAAGGAFRDRKGNRSFHPPRRY